jgi:thaumarchaeosortase
MSPLPKTHSDLVKSLRRITGRDVLLILTAVPIIFLFIVAPQTFELSWAGFGKLGRGGLAFVLFFLGFDLLDFKKAKIQWTTLRKIATAVTVTAATIYFIEVGLGQDVTNFIYSIGRSLGASGDVSNSFLMATDYIAMSIYLTVLTTILFSIKAIRRVVTPIVFSLGMLVFYILDAFFPYGSLGPLQFWANFIVAGVAFLAKIFGLPIYGFTNHLTIEGLHGYYRLVVYWPSVGVQSILIYSVVMIVIAAKLQAPLIRKVIYAAVGIGGTILLNVVRIFTISYYGYVYATSGQQLDAFHNAVGEVLFPIWIVVFLVLILEIEDRIAPARNTGHGRKTKKERSRRVRRNVKAGGH